MVWGLEESLVCGGVDEGDESRLVTAWGAWKEIP